jgi:zinc protease
MNKIFRIKLMLGLIICPALLTAQVKGRQETVLPLDPAVRTGKLPNGFTYYIKHNEEPKNRVVFFLANKVGSILEDEDQRGLAHFMEHMSFNGTRHFPKNELVNYLQKSGVRFGADLNAYTGFDETVYQLPLPTDKPDILQHGLEILRDWAQEATLDPLEIDKERGVVLEEKRLGKGASERMRQQYFSLILNGSRYSQRLPIGIDAVLNGFKPETIRRFYHDWYRPDLQALIVVGDIDVNQMEEQVKKKFGDLKNPANEKPRPKYGVSLNGKNKFIAVTDPEMTSTEIEVLIKHPEAGLKTEADYRGSIIQGLFNEMLSERFAEITRQEDPPFVRGNASIGALLGGVEVYDLSVTARPNELERGFKAAWRETERLKRYGFTQTELDRAKSNLLTRIKTALREKDKTSSGNYVQEYLQYFLNGTAAPGIEAETRLTELQLPGISLADLAEMTKAVLKDNDRDLLVMAPAAEKDRLPNNEQVSGWLKAVQEEGLLPYVDAISNKPLLRAEPTAGKIVSEQKNEAAGITTLTLSNGVKVILKPTTIKNEQVLFTGFSPGGTSLYEDADFQSASNAAGLISAGGAGNYSASALDKFLSGKQVAVSQFINERWQGVSGGSTIQDLPSALELVYARLTEPRLDTAIDKSLLTRYKASLTNRANDPNSVFQDSVLSIAYRKNIRRTGPSPEKIDQIDLIRAYSIYKERFANSSGLTFVFVGSFELENIKPLLAKYLGGLPSAGRADVAKDLDIHLAEGHIERNILKGREPKASVNLLYSGPIEYSPENRALLDGLKETLLIRLTERLREDESGVYSPSVSAIATKYPQGRYSFIISFTCAPQNVDKLITSAKDEITKLKNEGPIPVDIDKYKAEYSRIRETQLKTNNFWLNYLSGQLQNQEDILQFEHDGQIMNEIDQSKLKKATQQYLIGDNFLRFVLLPENNH